MSTVLLNTLTGKTSAGSIVVTGEGGSTTTNMQQGLAKAHCYWEATSTIVRGFNISSIDDDGTGDWDLNYTNNFSGTKNIVTTGIQNQFTSSNMVLAFVSSTNNATTDVTIFNVITSGTNQDSSNYVTVDGDLA
tara:strand:+ start:1639 stop:2040 length:402 start_codon:yes stop_codon:yes gene_type:complete